MACLLNAFVFLLLRLKLLAGGNEGGEFYIVDQLALNRMCQFADSAYGSARLDTHRTDFAALRALPLWRDCAMTARRVGVEICLVRYLW